MNILHVLAPAAYGGLERVVEALARGHRDLGHDVGVAVCDPRGEEHPLTAVLRASGVAVHVIPVAGRRYREERVVLAEVLRRARPRVVHTHGYRPDVLVPGVARRFGVPVVSTVHGFTGGDWKNRCYEALQRWSYRRVDGVVAVSRRLAGELARRGVPASRIHVLPNAWGETSSALPGEAARSILGVPPEAFHVGWVGRVSGEKGADVLLEALPGLGDVPVHVSFVGDGADLPRLRARTEALGLGARVTWHGAVPDAGRLFAGFDLFALSSRTEGTPVALFEAMAAGVPAVVSAVGGVPEVVSEEEAWLVPPEDPAALARAIRCAWSDRGEAGERAAAARRRLRAEFGLQPWLERYLDVYAQVQPVGTSRELCRA